MTTVRHFQAQDQSPARQLVLDGLGERFGFIDESCNPDLDDIETHYLASGHLFFVALCEGSIVGTAGLLLDLPSSARIVRMSTAKSRRREGIATALLQKIIVETRARSVPTLLAYTQPEWASAVSFYQRAGFGQIGRDEIDIHLRLAL